MKARLIPILFLVLFIVYPFVRLDAEHFKPSRTAENTGNSVEIEQNQAGRNNPSESEEEEIITHYDSIEVLVNKEHALPAGYEPPDLTVPDIPFSFTEDLPKKRMRKEAATAMENLFAQAEREGLDLAGVSAYRSYRRQAEIFAYNAKAIGETEANRVSARPGESEHQTGLAIDVSSPSVGYQLSKKFAETTEGRWLKTNAHRHGFIIRYPQNKEEITGYQYEPWHLRYVGKKIAAEIYQNGLTLEEYFSN